MTELFIKISKKFNEILDTLPPNGIERIKAIAYAEGLGSVMEMIIKLEKEKK